MMSWVCAGQVLLIQILKNTYHIISTESLGWRAVTLLLLVWQSSNKEHVSSMAHSISSIHRSAHEEQWLCCWLCDGAATKIKHVSSIQCMSLRKSAVYLFSWMPIYTNMTCCITSYMLRPTQDWRHPKQCLHQNNGCMDAEAVCVGLA